MERSKFLTRTEMNRGPYGRTKQPPAVVVIIICHAVRRRRNSLWNAVSAPYTRHPSSMVFSVVQSSPAIFAFYSTLEPWFFSSNERLFLGRLFGFFCGLQRLSCYVLGEEVWVRNWGMNLYTWYIMMWSEKGLCLND